jgi:hypothetical protein
METQLDAPGRGLRSRPLAWDKLQPIGRRVSGKLRLKLVSKWLEPWTS